MPTKKNCKKNDPLWSELAALEHVTDGVDQHALRLVQTNTNELSHKPVSALPMPKREKKIVRDYLHPPNLDDMPSFDEMLEDLSTHGGKERIYGGMGWDTAPTLALEIETKLYNAWTLWHCRKRGLRAPGALSEDQYRERFWDDDDDEGGA